MRPSLPCAQKSAESCWPNFSQQGQIRPVHVGAMGEAVLEKIAEVEDIELAMPNKHCLLVDLSRFGQDNPNEIFVPVDEPHREYLQYRLRRQV